MFNPDVKDISISSQTLVRTLLDEEFLFVSDGNVATRTDFLKSTQKQNTVPLTQEGSTASRDRVSMWLGRPPPERRVTLIGEQLVLRQTRSISIPSKAIAREGREDFPSADGRPISRKRYKTPKIQAANQAK